MPTYRSILSGRRRGNQFAPALVGAIGEGLKGLATGLQQKHQRNMDIEQSKLAQQRAEEEARSNKELEAWRQKQTSLEEAKLNGELSKSAVVRSQRREAVLRLESYLTENPEGLSDKELRAARIVLKTAGTSLDPDKLVSEFYKAIFEAGKPEKVAGAKDDEMSDSEVRLRTNKMIDLETENVEATKTRLEQEREQKKQQIQWPLDGKDNPQAVQKAMDEETQIDAEYDEKIAALVSGGNGKPGLNQRFSPEGYQAALDSTRLNLFAPPRLKESLAVLGKPRPDISAGPVAKPTEAKLGTAISKTPTKPNPAFAQPAPAAAAEQSISDEELVAMEADQVPVELRERYIELLKKAIAEEEAKQ